MNIAHKLDYPTAMDLVESPTWQSALRRSNKMFGQRTIHAYNKRPRFELYDLKNDPNEVNNLADQAEHVATLKSMQLQLKEWQTKSGDPWLVKWTYE